MLSACETTRRQKPVETLSMNTATWGLTHVWVNLFKTIGVSGRAAHFSPMMFILAMEPLQRNWHKATDEGILSQIEQRSVSILYADNAHGQGWAKERQQISSPGSKAPSFRHSSPLGSTASQSTLASSAHSIMVNHTVNFSWLNRGYYVLTGATISLAAPEYSANFLFLSLVYIYVHVFVRIGLQLGSD
jgi:hypothetical protein